MRITSEAMVLRSVDRLQTRLERYERAQTELATGRTILAPSDDPAGARRSISLRSSLQAREQELKNIDDARGWLDAADTQLQTVVDRLRRVRELATQGASHGDDNVRSALATEVRQITEEIAGIANTRHLDRPLFGGFSDENPVRPDRTIADGEDAVLRRVSDSEQVRINVTAAEWMVPRDGSPDLLAFLGQLADDLQAGDSAAISGHLGTLQARSTQVADNLSVIGAATNRIESARARSIDLSLTLRTELSNVEDLDLSRGIMELQIQEVAYEATLAALGRALPPSLVGFLR
jgi:flagellar hook-associated protein 3 FlgL